jgi:cytochrome c553
MMKPFRTRAAVFVPVVCALGVAAFASCKRDAPSPTALPSVDPNAIASAQPVPKDGPGIDVNPNPHQRGDAAAGKDVFRFETFGNEGFWTDAMRLPQGMAAAKVTLLDALKAGLQIDIEAVPAALKEKLVTELKTDHTPASAPSLHDHKVMLKLVEANAVAGLVPKDSNGDGRIDLGGADKLGISCTICHVRTDGSVYEMPRGGSVGKRVDGLAAVNLDTGKLLAIAANSRAYYPNLQGTFLGVTIGRAKSGLGAKSTEAEVDAYLSDHDNYPVGTFDETQDLNGNPVMNTPLFRQDLAAPYGSAGEFGKLENISNASYTTNLDPTTLVTPEGRAHLAALAGPAGKQLADEYEAILKETGVEGYPFVKAKMQGKPGEVANPVGRRVDDKKLLDMNAYLDALEAPRGAKVDLGAEARGKAAFRASCTTCHNVDQGKFVPPLLVDLKTMWPAYLPLPVGKRGESKLDAILNSVGGYDDKMVVVDASIRGEKRGVALPLLLDLARKERFLHDASVVGLASLLDPARGSDAPHPFYVADPSTRGDVVEFLRGLDTYH